MHHMERAVLAAHVPRGAASVTVRGTHLAQALGERTAGRSGAMAKCETCGNEYDKPMEVIVGGESHVFDCFECAIHAVAPRCSHCGCQVIGHGIEAHGTFYCCAHCAGEGGECGVRDRID
jgi:hypothetical protein